MAHPQSLPESSRSRSRSYPRPPFESLPTELVHNICTDLTFKDLQNLRLASRAMDNHVTYTMKADHRCKLKRIRVLLVPSEIRALEKFAERPLACQVTTLQLLKTDFETFLEDVESSPPPNAPNPPGPNDYIKANSWASKPLHSILPNLSNCHLVYERARGGFGQLIGEIMPSDFTLLRHLLGGFGTHPIKAAVAIDDSFVCKFSVDNSSSEIQIWPNSRCHRSAKELLHCKNDSCWQQYCKIHQRNQRLLQICCQHVEAHLIGKPIEKFTVFNLDLRVTDLQRLFEAINPPAELHLRGGVLDFEEEPIDEYWATTNPEAINSFVASLRPSLRRLSCRLGLLERNNASSWVCLFEALKTCDSLQSIAFDRGQRWEQYFHDPQQNGGEPYRSIFNGIFKESGSRKIETMVEEIGLQRTLDELIHCFRYHVR
ncbi:hypothetical protein HDK90DRAFT_541662 [Phyllosticta capitalensis]|uniref:F-box domain-containing protein n=1 Tax=Phyllosticta capitalensis TaxID=121624 RepID=A0ABR1YGG0_9PEZI